MNEVLQMLSTSQFWLDVLKIIVIDIMLSGDNAVVIALACRSLPEAQRKKGIFYGVLGAIVLRITLTFFAVSLLSLPFLKAVGALMLIWIGVKLILPEEEHDASNVQASTRLWGAVRTILIADFIMSLDNVLGVAAAAHGSLLLLGIGLLVSIPLVAWSSQLVLKVLDRFPIIIYFGGALLGYVAGEMLLGEEAVKHLLEGAHEAWHWLPPLTGALLVVAAGKLLALRQLAAAKPVDLVDEQVAASRREQDRD
ncbi:MAG TPA: TerC family protein [Gallionellaceae bacterium]